MYLFFIYFSVVQGSLSCLLFFLSKHRLKVKGNDVDE